MQERRELFAGIHMERCYNLQMQWEGLRLSPLLIGVGSKLYCLPL